MKQKIFILIAFLLLSAAASGQSIRDSVFNEVIPVNWQNVSTDGKDFLIDIPIQAQKEPIIIFNNDRRIPVELFFDRRSFLNEQDEIVLITSDWEYYDRIRASEERIPGLHLAPYRQNKFYHIKRMDTHYVVDSISRAMEVQTFTIIYKKAQLLERRKYYYAGALSLTNDNIQRCEKWNALDSLNKHFEIYPGSYYSLGFMYYTLPALPLEKKLPAIKAIAAALRFKDNAHLKDFDQAPKIYLPHTIHYDSFDCYVESSKDSPHNPALKGWQEKDNTATIRLGYWRGDCCGGVAKTERVSVKIMNDTVYINYNQKRQPNCDSSIGICGNAIDFVINKRKYPNYKQLKFKTTE